MSASVRTAAGVRPALRPRVALTPDRRLDLIGLAVIVATVLWGLVLGRHLWFFSDEWNIMGTYPSGNLLTPFNGHLSLVPVALYQAVFH
ncbi:MAG: hypothetical protein GX868_18375, partial [Actinobacteria bacterium]|nr:hypothetical protein [Actinomycetota bacterium]